MRTIESIRKAGQTVYVNFDNGTFGTRTLQDGTWTNCKLSTEELSEARRLALRDGKWTSYRAPRNTTPAHVYPVRLDEEDLAAEAERDFHQPITFASPSDTEQ